MSGIWAVRRPATRVPANLLRAGAISIAMIGAVGLTVGLVLASSAASAAPAPEPRLVEGNVTTCEGAGLTGSILFGSDSGGSGPAGSGTVSGGTTLDVTINAGFTASGIVVKGGPDTNVYDGPFVGPVTIEGMTPPPNPGGNTPDISHWFVCGEETPPTPSPPESPSPSASPSLSPSPSPSPPETPLPSPSGTPGMPTSPPPTPELPVTGTGISLLVGGGAALLASGALLIAFTRQRRHLET